MPLAAAAIRSTTISNSDSYLRIATWNVRTLNADSKLEQLIERMQEYRIDICCLTEVRYPHSGSKKCNGWQLLFSGRDDGKRRQGVGVLLGPRVASALLDSQDISEGVMSVQIQLKKHVLSVICAYAPTLDYPAHEKDNFYSELQSAVDKVPARDVLIVGGDFNAQVGAEQPSHWNGCLGSFALKRDNIRTNDMGTRLLDFCSSNELVLRNTFFDHKRIHLATWTGPGDLHSNQIDFLIIRRAQARLMTNCRVHRGAELETDHFLLVGSCKVDLRFRRARQVQSGSYDVKLLSDDTVRRNYQSKLQQSAAELLDPASNVETTWKLYAKCLHDGARQTIESESRLREDWISQATWELVQEKKQAWKRVKQCMTPEVLVGLRQQYRHALNACRKAVKADKKRYWRQLADDLHRDFHDGKLRSAYKRVRLRDDLDRVQPLHAKKLRRPDGSYTSEPKEKASLLRQYFSTLLNCRRPIAPALRAQLTTATPDEAGHMSVDPPNKCEVEAAVKKLKNHKAAGLCGILPEMLKCSGEAGTNMLHTLITRVWESGRAPADWKRSLLVPLLKKGDPTDLGNYRGISLLSLPGKVYALILKQRLQNWAEGSLLEGQCGFRKGRGCNDAIFTLKSLLERAHRKDTPVQLCFIDLSKAYDSVDRDLAWCVMRQRGAPTKLVALLKDLHEGTECAMQSDCTGSQSWFPVSTGFKQGDVNAPMLFNVFLDSICRCIERRVCHMGINVGYNIDGHLTRCNRPASSFSCWIILYADDIAILTDSQEKLQEILEILQAVFADWGVEINVGKTKVMQMGAHTRVPILIGGDPIEYVSTFRYLGSYCSDNISMRVEVNHRLSSAAFAFQKLKRLNVWNDPFIRRGIKSILYKVIVQSTLLFGCETWALPEAELSRLEVFQMRCLRTICSLSIIDRIPNEEILQRCSVSGISDIIKYRRLRWLGHVARMDNNRLPKMMMFSTLEGDGRRGRPVKSWNDYVRHDLETLGISLTWWRKSQDRPGWKAIIQKLLRRT